MNSIKYISILLFSILCLSCAKVEILDAPEFDLTEIVSFKAYDSNKNDIASDNPVIDTNSYTVTVTLKENIDLKSIFATCGLSSGATISPVMNGYEDWSSMKKVFTVTSASGKHSHQWTIILQH